MITWDIHPDNPVIIPGQLHPELDQHRAGAAHIIEENGRYRMVYWGSNKQGENYILSAYSAIGDPHRWHPSGIPLIGPQPHTIHNNQGPSFPFLLPVSESRHLLYYTGWGTPSAKGKLPNTTGVAISDDGGKHWRYHNPHPVIPLDRPYDKEGTGSVWVLHENGRFRMYYTAIGRYVAKPPGVPTGHGDTIPEIGIAYAESDDGLHWDKPVDSLVVSPRLFGVDPYEYICSKPCVIRTPSGYMMWVNTFGTAYRVHRLTSTDGLHWSWAHRQGPDGELGVGHAGAFDHHQRSYPTIVKSGHLLHCWYTGNGFGSTGMGYATSRWSETGS